MSSGCGKAPGIASSMYNNGTPHLDHGRVIMQRRYILNVPTNYDNTHPYRLIIAYHELNGNDVEMYNQSITTCSRYPTTARSSSRPTVAAGQRLQRHGSGDSGCGWPNSNNADLTFADALVAQIEQNFCVDTNRIFATGWSYGGSMSYKTACERPLGGVTNGYIRAVAVYSGSQLSGNCTPSKPVAYYASHGTSRFGAELQQRRGGIGPELREGQRLHLGDADVGHERHSRLHQRDGVHGGLSGGVLLLQRRPHA